VNETIRKFGWPDTLVREFDHWVVLARPAQATLGSLILAAKSDATSFAHLDREAYAELQIASAAIEAALGKGVRFDKINYLMLMMVDPHVHFHVIPRYAGERQWRGREFVDIGWPRVPDLGHSVTLEGQELTALVDWLKDLFGE
jgi:diadenosine tetraphosphate (Ap4A) HIT family hydrolase